jgi:hypothetical protein
MLGRVFAFLAHPIEGRALVLATSPPLDQHPAAVYLAGLSEGGRRTMRQALDRIAELVSGGQTDALGLDWAALRFQHTAAIRAELAKDYAPATANKILSALRGVLRAGLETRPPRRRDLPPSGGRGRARAALPAENTRLGSVALPVGGCYEVILLERADVEYLWYRVRWGELTGWVDVDYYYPWRQSQRDLGKPNWATNR